MSAEKDTAEALADKGEASIRPAGRTDDTGDSGRKRSAQAGASSKATSTEPASRIREAPKTKRKKTKQEDPSYPVQPNVIQVINKPRTYVDHSYRDFSNMPVEPSWEFPKKREDMSYPQKLYELLSSNSEYTRQYIRWCSHGRAFQVVDPKNLAASGILKTHFGHNRYAQFVRMLANHGFKSLTVGRDSGCFYSEVSKH